MARISKNELIRLQKKHHTDAKIGEEFGITRQAVHQLRKKYGIASRTAGNPERNKEMVGLRENGKTVEAIARKFKLSIPQTYRILKENNPKSSKKAAAKKGVGKTLVKKGKSVVKKVAAKKSGAAKVISKAKATSKKTVKKAPAKKAPAKKAVVKKAPAKKAAAKKAPAKKAPLKKKTMKKRK